MVEITMTGTSICKISKIKESLRQRFKSLEAQVVSVGFYMVMYV